VHRILVAYDGSEGGRRALDRASAEARLSKGHITVLSVEEVPLDPNVPRNFGTLDDISAWEGAAPSAPPEVVAHLAEARDMLNGAGLSAELIWAAGETGHVIVETARRIHADVIVLGEHHHGRLASLFGSNVDAEVQREAGCDVILA
jgi:nucleotide-binding universal stress UspA family protein